MKKFLLMTVIMLSLAFGSIFIIETNANTGLLNEVVEQSGQEVRTSIYQKKEELKTNAETLIKDKVTEYVNQEVSPLKTQYANELESYFYSQVEQVKDDPQIEWATGQIDSSAKSLVEAYKKELDALVSEVLGN